MPCEGRAIPRFVLTSPESLAFQPLFFPSGTTIVSPMYAPIVGQGNSVRCGATENTRLYETRPFLAYGAEVVAPSRASPISRKSAVKQRWPDHPGDFPFSSVALLYTNDAAKVKLHDFSFFVARNKQSNEFAEKRQVADDHHVAAVLFERFFRSGNVVLLPSPANIARLNRGDRDCSVGWRSRPSAWRCPSACRHITSALAIFGLRTPRIRVIELPCLLSILLGSK